jgi:dienelactone hydrolase
MPTRREVLELLAVAPVAGLAGSALTASPAAAAPATTTAPATNTGPAPTAGPGRAGSRPDVLVRDVSVPVPGQDAVPAYLVLPGRRRPAHTAPAVLFLHWFDPASTNSDRTEFLAEAVRLAERGAVSLLPQQAFPWAGDPVGDARDVATIRRELARMRRALDALLRRPEVDPHRVAVVGHDYGAMYGALLAAADPRVRALAALTPDATWAHWFLAYWLQRDDPAYAALFARLEPVDAVARVAAHRPVLLQFADDDEYVDAATRDRFRAAAPAATQTVFHRAGHRLDLAALQERTAWLTRVLGLPE